MPLWACLGSDPKYGLLAQSWTVRRRSPFSPISEFGDDPGRSGHLLEPSYTLVPSKIFFVRVSFELFNLDAISIVAVVLSGLLRLNNSNNFRDECFFDNTIVLIGSRRCPERPGSAPNSKMAENGVPRRTVENCARRPKIGLLVRTVTDAENLSLLGGYLVGAQFRWHPTAETVFEVTYGLDVLKVKAHRLPVVPGASQWLCG